MRLIVDHDAQPEIREAVLATWNVGESLADVTASLPPRQSRHRIYTAFRLVDRIVVSSDEEFRQATFLLLYRS